MPGGRLQGYSPILNLLLRWENRQLRWHNPETGQRLATFSDERARADREREVRRQAEVRSRELQARLDRMGDQ